MTRIPTFDPRIFVLVLIHTGIRREREDRDGGKEGADHLPLPSHPCFLNPCHELEYLYQGLPPHIRLILLLRFLLQRIKNLPRLLLLENGLRREFLSFLPLPQNRRPHPQSQFMICLLIELLLLTKNTFPPPSTVTTIDTLILHRLLSLLLPHPILLFPIPFLHLPSHLDEHDLLPLLFTQNFLPERESLH